MPVLRQVALLGLAAAGLTGWKMATRFFGSRPKALLRAVRRKAKASDYWFEDVDTSLSGAQSNTVDEDAAAWTAPAVYHPAASLLSSPNALPFTSIPDNTEGIAAYHDIDFPKDTATIADFGGGAFDGIRTYVCTRKAPGLKAFYVLDPFNRSKEHNLAAQKEIEAAGGVDCACAMSVLNVIPSAWGRVHLINTVYSALKPGGVAFFKVWAGSWPARGTGQEVLDLQRGVYQANKWASAYADEVTAVFGEGNVFADDNKNLLVARRVA